MIKTITIICLVICLIVLSYFYCKKTKVDKYSLNDAQIIAIYNKMAWYEMARILECKCKPNDELCEKCMCLKMGKTMDFYIKNNCLPLEGMDNID